MKSIIEEEKYGIEEALDITLTPKQRSYIGAINWLVDEARYPKSELIGRSFLMAVVFICKALENRNNWIKVWDHFPWWRGKLVIFNQVVSLLHRNKELLELTEFRTSDYTFRIKEEIK